MLHSLSVMSNSISISCPSLLFFNFFPSIRVFCESASSHFNKHSPVTSPTSIYSTLSIGVHFFEPAELFTFVISAWLYCLHLNTLLNLFGTRRWNNQQSPEWLNPNSSTHTSSMLNPFSHKVGSLMHPVFPHPKWTEIKVNHIHLQIKQLASRLMLSPNSSGRNLCISRKSLT